MLVPIAIVLASLLVGCFPVPATWFDEIRYDNMAPRLEYQGFSFDRPPNRKWYLRQSEQSHTDVTLRREIFSPSITHTFYAQVSLGGIEEVPSSHENFAELARSRGQQAPYEIRTVSYEQHLTTRQNQWCIRVESSHIAIGAPQAPDSELTMILRGFRCLHPAWPKVTLDFFYSERGLADEIDPKLSEEGEAFLRGVRIDVAPGTPAVQQGLAADNRQLGVPEFCSATPDAEPGIRRYAAQVSLRTPRGRAASAHVRLPIQRFARWSPWSTWSPSA